MNKGSVRAGSLLFGVAATLALPALAMGQVQPVGEAIDEAGQHVQRTLPQVPVPAPVQKLTAPAKPAAPAPSKPPPAAGRRGAPAKPAAPAPSTAGPRAAAPSTSAAAPATPSSSGDASKPGGSPRASGKAERVRAGKAHAASGNAAGADRVLARSEEDVISESGAGGFGANGTRPSTGVTGNSKLPFTGGYLLLVLALGAGALGAGRLLRTASKVRV